MGLEIYNKFRKPPVEALKKINGGRMNGKTDINPQWRYEAMTEAFGPIGVGWYFEEIEHWNEVYDVEVLCFVRIALYINVGNDWSKPIMGTGGNVLRTQERNGVHVTDEGYKMATTDALSTAMKLLGIGADIYAGRWDGSKYTDEAQQQTPQQKQQPKVPAKKQPINFSAFKKVADLELAKFPDAQAAIESFSKVREVTLEAEAFIKEWFETKRPVNG